MKSSGLFIALIAILFFLFCNSACAQDVGVHEMIGKKLSVVINKYGKPAHQDRTDPSMECVFYKTATYQMVFVSNQSGVFQAEGSKSFGSKSDAVKSLSDLMKRCTGLGFTTDTVNVSEYNLESSGVKMNISLFENSFSKKYEVKVKANKTES